MSAQTPLREAIDARCQAIRNGTLQPYAAMLRDNAHEAVLTTFPRFCRLRGTTELAKDIDAFVALHGARSAAFVHLASEFLLSVRPRLDPRATTLIEYEWSLLDCEIDPARVDAPVGPGRTPSATVRPNPTLRLLAVPFAIKTIDDLASADALPADAPLIHALYRNHLHEVLARALMRSDVQNLSVLMQTNAPADIHLLPTAWIDAQLTCGLLVAAPSTTPGTP